jgi:hypothetical protein
LDLEFKCGKNDPQNKEKERNFMLKHLSGGLKDSFRAWTSFEGLKKKLMFFQSKKFKLEFFITKYLCVVPDPGSGLDPDSAEAWILIRIQRILIRKIDNSWSYGTFSHSDFRFTKDKRSGCEPAPTGSCPTPLALSQCGSGEFGDTPLPGWLVHAALGIFCLFGPRHSADQVSLGVLYYLYGWFMPSSVFFVSGPRHSADQVSSGMLYYLDGWFMPPSVFSVSLALVTVRVRSVQGCSTTWMAGPCRPRYFLSLWPPSHCGSSQFGDASVPDPDPPDPHVFGPPGSGSFYHHAKILRKTLIPSILWLFWTFYLWKMM